MSSRPQVKRSDATPAKAKWYSPRRIAKADFVSDATSAALPEDKRFRSHLRLALPMYHAIRWIVLSTSQLLYEHPNNVSSAFNIAWAWAFGAVLMTFSQYLLAMAKRGLDLHACRWA